LLACITTIRKGGKGGEEEKREREKRGKKGGKVNYVSTHLPCLSSPLSVLISLFNIEGSAVVILLLLCSVCW
jgi:hypothetical protein